LNLPDTFAWDIHRYDEVSSTNDVAAVFAAQGAPEGIVIIANAQTAGRGRLGRSWESPSRTGLYVSVLLRPVARAVPLLTIAAGVALVEGIATSTGLRATLKWPNDIYVSGRKLAGILAEAGAAAGGVSHVIVGFGINLRAGTYPPEVAARATSLAEELGCVVDDDALLSTCLAALAARYDDLQNGRSEAVLHDWREYARPLLGRPVEWDERGAAQHGVAEDVDATGALMVRTGSGVMRVVAGEVRWI
jgi:BirA family transcriptional regulator, biotin operon repressor / biotin---[acetyl-CoA-carboxylase] ligase